jgi:subtilisin family serine protease
MRALRETRCRAGVLAILTATAGLVGAALAGPASNARAFVADPAAARQSLPPGVGQLVVKLAAGATIHEVNRLLGSTTRSVILASRSIYLVSVPFTATQVDPNKAADEWAKQAHHLVDRLKKSRAVVYAEANTDADSTEGERFHYWPNGGPTCGGQSSTAYADQPAAHRLRLAEAHRTSTGAGTVVAVLDTGIVAGHPAFAGRIAPGGYDYVDDDPDPSERRDLIDQDRDGRIDEGYGHGTFVAGIVALVAPGAKILPERVLDTEGRGSVFTVAEAIYDATAAGADVINMSFGTAARLDSKILDDAVHSAMHAGVVFVAAAGNDGTADKHYPAALNDVLSVGALDDHGAGLAPFSSHGDWVELAAPGVHITSALPCGYGTWSGTSMAAPFVSGEAALLLAVAKKHKADDVGHNIRDGSDKVPGLSVHDGVIDLLRSLSRQRGH